MTYLNETNRDPKDLRSVAGIKALTELIDEIFPKGTRKGRLIYERQSSPKNERKRSVT